MALTVSSDLSVNVTVDQNVNKLMDRQEVLKRSIQKGEPKSIGVSHLSNRVQMFSIYCYI